MFKIDPLAAWLTLVIITGIAVLALVLGGCSTTRGRDETASQACACAVESGTKVRFFSGTAATEAARVERVFSPGQQPKDDASQRR